MPSSGIAIENIKNITDNTLNNYVRDAVNDLYLDLTQYVGYMLCNSGQFDEVMTNGVKKQWQLLVDGLEHDTHVGPYSQITLSDNTISSYAQLAMRHTITHFLMDYLENDANSSPAALVNLVKLKTQAMMEGHVKSDENWIWSCPAQGDDKTPLGIPAWVVMYDSTDSTPAAGGFLGTYPYGGGAEWTTTPDGVDPATYSLAANYAAKYTSVSFDDLVDKMITAADLTNFQAPTAMMQLVKDMPKDTFTRAVYVPHTVKRGLEKLCKSQQSDNKSGDVAFEAGSGKFMGRPIVYVPKLDSVTGAPVYMLNHKALKFLKNPKRDGALGGTKEVSTEQPTSLVRHYLWSRTTICFQRKTQAVLSTTNKQGT